MLNCDANVCIASKTQETNLYSIFRILIVKRELQISLFYEMLRIRRIEEAIDLRYKEQRMRCPIHLSIGQEAVAVGVCFHLKKEDAVFSNHRSHAHYLAKGGSLSKMIAELHGKQTGCTKGRGGSMHLLDLDVGFQGASPLAAGSLPLAAGFAFANGMKNLPSVCCAFFGERATEEGLFSETLHFAALKELSMLFVCENNFQTVCSSTHEKQEKKRELPLKIAKAHAIFTLSCLENRIEPIYEMTQKALEYIQENKKPAFIEFKTYRLCESIISPRSGVGLCLDKKRADWEKYCPVLLSREHLFREGSLSLEQLEGMEEKIASEIEESFAFARDSPFPIFDLDNEKAYAD